MTTALSRNRHVLGALLMVPLMVAGFTQETRAAEHAGLFHRVSRLAVGPVVPLEWAGVWAYTDSAFTCTGIFLEDVVVGNDTLCAGAILSDEGDGTVTDVICSGSADATTVSVTCTGSTEVLPDCQAVYTSTTTGVRTGETYRATFEYGFTFNGGGAGCGDLPPYCFRIRTSATRIGPEPPACSTAVNEAHWGVVKLLYQ